MDALQVGYSVALAIGAAIVGWCALRCETLADRMAGQGERIAKLEAHASRCKCEGAGDAGNS